MKIQRNKYPGHNITVINYANHKYTRGQRKNSRTALSVAGAKEVISFGPPDIDKEFRAMNDHILKQSRGNGYWLWKPYFIFKTLNELEENALLFYSDSGAFFIDSFQDIIRTFEESGQDIMPFELQQPEKKWTKRDVFLTFGCDDKSYVDTKQRLGGFSLWKKTNHSLQFVKEWLKYAQDIDLISDSLNRLGHKNYPEFIEHRHDQSIYSVLTKKYGLKAFRDPSQFGNNYFHLHPRSSYPQLLNLERQRNLTLKKWIKKKIKKFIKSL